MNYGRFAPVYQRVEYLLYGKLLERCRFYFVDRLASARSILILGEGDGRFLKRLCALNSVAEITVVEFSLEMIKKAKTRIHSNDLKRITFIEASALTLDEESQYDVVVTCFFLDNFSRPNVRHLVEKIERLLLSEGCWLNADFYIPKQGIMRHVSQIHLYVLYRVFRILAGVEAKKLHLPTLYIKKMKLLEEKQFLNGLLISSIYKKGSLYE